MDCLRVVQCVGGKFQMCLLCLRDLPTLIVVPAFYLTKKSKRKRTRTLPIEILGSLNFIIITFILLFIITIIIIFIFLFYVLTELFII